MRFLPNVEPAGLLVLEAAELEELEELRRDAPAVWLMAVAALCSILARGAYGPAEAFRRLHEWRSLPA